jgi:hypothetical protein
MRRLALASMLALAAVAGTALHAAGLVGRVEGDTYVSPTGAFKIRIPVLAGLGGGIVDTPSLVTFQDEVSTHISIVAIPQDATERWEMDTRGTKDYLIYFFKTYAFADFQRTYKDAKIESALFIPGYMGGAMIAYVLLPGGSMFADHYPSIATDAKPPVAKRGNLIFVKNGFVFVVSTELAERVIEGSAYSMTTDDENVLLRERLTDIVARMQFLPQPGEN